MSTYLNETEKQDIAMIAIEKTGNEKAVLHIEGDEDLFAKNTFFEPNIEENTTVQNINTQSNSTESVNNTVVNVWFWPSVRFLYGPRYVVWGSPYRWRVYPRWWRPWRPIAHTIFYANTIRYRPHYHYASVRRVAAVRTVYYPRRHSSTLVVHNRRGTTVVHKNRRGTTVKDVKVRRTPARARRR